MPYDEDLADRGPGNLIHAGYFRHRPNGSWRPVCRRVTVLPSPRGTQMRATTAGSYRSALRHADLRRLLGALTISALGSWAYNVALVAYVYDRTGSTAWVGAIALGRFVPSLLFSSYAGVLAERFERVRVMITSDLLCATYMIAMAGAMAAGASPLWVIILAALASTTACVYMPATSAMVPQVVGEDDLAAANGLNAAIDNLSVLAGPAIGALLMLAVSPASVVAVNAGSFLVSALIVRGLAARSKPTDVAQDGNPLRQMLVGVKAIGASSTAALLVGFCVLASFVYGTDTVLFVVLSQDKLGTGSNFGYLLAAYGVGGLIGATFVNRLAKSPRLGLVISLGMLVYCLPTALLVGVTDPRVAFALVCVRGAGTLVVDTLAVTALQRSLSPDLIARVFGVFMALVLAAISLGALMTPFVLQLTSLDTTLLVLGLGIPGAVLLAVPWTTALDRKGAQRLAELQPRIAVLEALGIFAAANRAALERLAAASVEVLQPDAGQDVVVEGDPATALYVLIDGEVEVLARGEGQQTRHIRTMPAPAYFGEIGLIRQVPRTATVRTTMPSRFLRVDGEVFLAALSDVTASPSLTAAVSSRLARTHPSLVAAAVPQQRPAEQDAPIA